MVGGMNSPNPIFIFSWMASTSALFSSVSGRVLSVKSQRSMYIYK